MKKKLSLFMIATTAVVGLSLATPENQTVSANDASYSNGFYGQNAPDNWLLYTVW
ncbi:SpoV family signaling peptide [Streptococcus pyogenes]|uniref:SpoV family signaling peptide n=1 Tax=Streptococcus pyogenes TaxID=1314 RepID=UPI0010A0D5D5|nr:SpoV family signaling peptide [Streptococcus pyogenes]VHB90897.1 Uncharacterised protein [Streptococcus pyogenes]VHB95526.1 Uncharacterised protein [Streptococcus pyogenes]VHB99873.1 Uncharacterised protein [Streptococcus pyogenes]